MHTRVRCCLRSNRASACSVPGRSSKRACAELTELGFRHRIVAAPNPAAARVLADIYDGLAIDDEALMQALAPLPIDRAGLRASGRYRLVAHGPAHPVPGAGLARHTLARRFDAGLLEHLDALTGQRPLALGFHQPPDQFDVRIELNFDVQSHQALLFPLRRLTADLSAFLCGRDSGVQRFDLHLEHAQLPDSVIKVGLLSAEREPAMLFDWPVGAWSKCSLTAPVRGFPPGGPGLAGVRAAAPGPVRRPPEQTLPWEANRERLRARLGDQAVQGLAVFMPTIAPVRLASNGRQSAHAPDLEQGATPRLAAQQFTLLTEQGVQNSDGPGTYRIRLAGTAPISAVDYHLIHTRAGSARLGLPQRGAGRWFVAARLVCMNYAELHCLSNFSFQRGASTALELFERAKRQGYSALAITDECTLSGIVRAWQAAKAVELPLIIGSEVRIENGPKLVLLVEKTSAVTSTCAA